MFIHDLIKVKYIQEGYTANYPPHLISDKEMIEAFLSYYDYDYRTLDEIEDGVVLTDDQRWERFLEGTEPCFFRDNYPLVDKSLNDQYRKLVDEICFHITEFLESLEDQPKLPDWVYSYMLGYVIGPASSQLDKHYLLCLMGVDNTMDDYNLLAAKSCYEDSCYWLSRYSANLYHRPPTMFGEPHVIKYLRLNSMEV